MNKSSFPKFEFISMIVGEAAVSLIVSLVFILLKKFTFAVALGSLLGSVVIILNFLFLIITANRAIDNALAARGDGELSEEEAERFAQEYQSKIQASVKLSYIIRTFSLIAALVLALILTDVFNVISTLVPLLMYQPILTISQIIKKRRDNNG